MKHIFFIITIFFINILVAETFEIPVCIDELIDKITILQIKRERITNPEKNGNVTKELNFLLTKAQPFLQSPEIVQLMQELFEVNETLWDIEDKLRIYESNKIGDLSVNMTFICNQMPPIEESYSDVVLYKKNIDTLIHLKHSIATIHEFVMLARLVYFWNDRRGALKRKINILSNSDLMEEK